MTRDSYFTILVEVFTNHVLAKKTYFTNHIVWTEHEITVSKSANKYQIIRQCQKYSYRRCPASSISLLSKSFVNITFYKAENDKFLRQDDPSFKSLFTIWVAQKNEKYFIKLYNSCSLMKFQGISKFMARRSRPLQTLMPFYIRINTSGVKIMPISKKSWCPFFKVGNVKSWHRNNSYNLHK